MKLGKGLPPPSKSDKRMLAVSALVFLATCVFVAFAVTNRNKPILPDNSGEPLTIAVGTPMSAEVITQLTAMPAAPPLTGALADEIHGVKQMVAGCTDYSQPRRDQMNQHIAWLLQPSTLPKDVIIALGTNINGRLIYGMATYTLSEWGQHANAPDSCLLTIGKKLNDMLVANGETHFTEFDGTNG